jgi:hypothetical protein
VIDSLGSPPVILVGTISPAIVNLDTIAQNIASIQFTATARVTHQDGLTQVSRVDYTVSDEAGSESLATGQLFDNGVFPDRSAGDSVYTAQIMIAVQSLPVGKYYFQINAQDPHGFTSNTFLFPIVIGRQLDLPPVLSNLQAPDTIVLAGQTQEFKLSVKAADPDGQSDIAKVFFNSFKPNGTSSSGNPFLMYDDGSENVIYAPDITSGDAVKGDGVYTLTVQISPTAALGTYRFEFQASDRSNVLSQKLIKYVQVIQ